MTDSVEPGSEAWENLVNDGWRPEVCPVCSRVNFANGPDFCTHYWGTVYDGEMIEGPFADEYEFLWARLQELYQAADDLHADSLIVHLKKAAFGDIAEAMVDCDPIWWIDQVTERVVIEPEESLASGSGWNLYAAEPDWFEGVMRPLRSAVDMAERTVTE